MKMSTRMCQKNMSYMLEIVSPTQKEDEQVAPNNNMVNNESDNTNNIIYDYVWINDGIAPENNEVYVNSASVNEDVTKDVVLS